MTEVLLSQATIPVAALDIVQERVERIARRATRRGFPVPSLVVGEYETRSIAQPDAPAKQVEYVEVSVYAADRLQIGGWTFLARVDQIEINGEVKPFFARVPGTDDIPLPEWDKAPDACDHCGLRRQRNETFVLARARQHSEIAQLPPSGVHSPDCKWLCKQNDRVCQRIDHALCALCGPEYKQVGRQCVRDFIGYDPDALIAAIDAYDELVFDEDEISGWGSAAPSVFRVDEVLDAAARAVLNQGFYVSKAKAQESEEKANWDEAARRDVLVSTGEVARLLLTPPRDEREKAERRQWTEIDPDKVAAVITATRAALDELPAKSDTSEWEDNVYALSQADHVKWQHVGILASSVVMGWRRLERLARARVAAEKAPSRYIGEVGKRLDFEAVIELVRFFDNDWGGTFLVRMRHDDGDMIWWSSAEPFKEKPGPDNSWQGMQFATGDRVKVRATIKAHEIDKYTSQPVSVLSRAKLSLVPPPAPPMEAPEREPDQLPF